MTSKRMKRYSIHVVFALLLLIMSAIGGRYIPSAFADTDGYTTAIEDLQHDETFKPSAYPDNPEDIKIQLIQIAESEDKELFVYTYQPCQRTTYLVATELNMSLSESVDGTKLYPLELLNVSGTLCKYRVTGVTVSDVKARYYNISSIYREWIKGIDKEPDNDNTTNAVAHEVGQLWIVTETDGRIAYSNKSIDVITITNSYVGSIRYLNKSIFYTDACDSFFIAFTSDRPIHSLFEADVDFSYYPYSCTVDRNGRVDKGSFHSSPSSSKHEIAKLKADGSTDVILDGIRNKHYTWKWIQSAKDFKADEVLSEEQSENISDDSWVLRFFASELIMTPNGGLLGTTGYSVHGYMPANVAILRLKFEYMGKVYDLGAVSNKVTGGKPDLNVPESSWSLFVWLEQQTGMPQWFWILLILFIPLCIVLLILSIFFPIIRMILGMIVKGVVWLLKGVLRLLLLPFKGIAALVRKIKSGKDGAA